MNKNVAYSKKFLRFFILAFAINCYSINVCAIRKPIPRSAALIPALILLYSNIYLHELGHKYTAKLLTGAESDIHMGFLSGYTEFDADNSKLLKRNPKSQIAVCLAGPLVGALGAWAVKALADLLNDAPWRFEIQQQADGLLYQQLVKRLYSRAGILMSALPAVQKGTLPQTWLWLVY